MRKLKIMLVVCAMVFFAMGNAPITHCETSYCQYGQCIKFKKDGTRCENCAQKGSSYCWSHR